MNLYDFPPVVPSTVSVLLMYARDRRSADTQVFIHTSGPFLEILFCVHIWNKGNKRIEKKVNILLID
jgi:hypothetical protein